MTHYLFQHEFISSISSMMDLSYKKHQYTHVESLDQVPRWDLAVVLANYEGNGIIKDIYSGCSSAVLFNGNVMEPRIDSGAYVYWIEQVDMKESGMSRFNVLNILRPRKIQRRIFLKLSENLSWDGVSDDSWMLDVTSVPSSTSPNAFGFSDQEVQAVDKLINNLDRAACIYEILDFIIENAIKT